MILKKTVKNIEKIIYSEHLHICHLGAGTLPIFDQTFPKKDYILIGRRSKFYPAYYDKNGNGNSKRICLQLFFDASYFIRIIKKKISRLRGKYVVYIELFGWDEISYLAGCVIKKRNSKNLAFIYE